MSKNEPRVLRVGDRDRTDTMEIASIEIHNGVAHVGVRSVVLGTLTVNRARRFAKRAVEFPGDIRHARVVEKLRVTATGVLVSATFALSRGD